jgi:hypothetical protein
MENQTPPQQETELLTGGALEAIERANIDMAVATAKKYPRSIKQFMADAESMISIDPETAESCVYKLKRTEKDGSLKWIEGPSIRLLEIAASAYTNIRYGSRVIGIDDTFVTCQGVSHDLQRNVYSSVEVKRRITTKDGRRFGDDMIMITANACGSIARRNALNGVVPRSYINQLAEFARRTAVGDIKTLPERRQRAIDYFTKTLGVPLAKVLEYLEKKAIEDCDLGDLEKLNGLRTALKDNEASVDETFNLGPKAKAPTGLPKQPGDTPAPSLFSAGTGAPTAEPKAPVKLPEPSVTELRKLLAEANLTEAGLMTYLQQSKAIDDTLRNLEEVAQISPAAISTSILDWDAIKPKIPAPAPLKPTQVNLPHDHLVGSKPAPKK